MWSIALIGMAGLLARDLATVSPGIPGAARWFRLIRRPTLRPIPAPARAGRRSDRCDRSRTQSATRQATDAPPGPFADRDFTREPRAHADRPSDRPDADRTLSTRPAPRALPGGGPRRGLPAH